MKKLVFILACLALSACAKGYTAVGPGAVPVGGGDLVVAPSQAWNKAPPGGVKTTESWTWDGANLDSLTFIGGIGEGEAFVKPANKDDEAPTFRADMLPSDIAEMIEATFVSRNNGQFEMTSLKPREFAGGEGFEISYDYMLQSDLVERKGLAVGAIRGGELYLILFEAPNLYYYNRHLEAASRVINSARIE